MLYRLGAFAARHPWRVVVLWVSALVAVIGLAATVGGALHDNYDIPGTGAQRGADLLERSFPAMSGADARVVVHNTAHDSTALAPAGLADAAARLEASPHVTGVGAPTFSADRRTALIDVRFDVPVTSFDGREGVEILEHATEPLRADGLTVEYGGQVPENIGAPSGTGEMIGITAALIILLLAFGSIVAAGLPLAIAVIGLGVGLSGITLLAAVADVSTIAPTIATMIGLGVGIDYALFIVTRYRDGLASGLDKITAVARANATAGQSVVFAGSTVLVSILGLALAGMPNFALMGYATGIVVAVMVITAVTLLPALLSLAGERVFSKRVRRAGIRPSVTTSAWATRWAQRVGRRPLPWAIASLALLLVLAAPMLGMRTWPQDAGSEPDTNTVRRAYALVAEGFGPGANGPFLVAVDLQTVPVAELAGLHDTLTSVSGVAAVAPPVVSPAGTGAVISVIPTTAPDDVATAQLLDRLRAGLPPGVEITGWTPAMADMSDVLGGNLWKVIAAVVGLALVLLLFAFRSVVVAVKAAAMNLLSIGAAFGVMVAVFQWGWGVELLGLPHAIPISSYIPMFMFAILFGLSMDYEVFLLSRIREEWLRTGDNRGSVIAGLGSTARVISSAAVIMVAVFIGFALDPSAVVKMMGVGLATAVALDATVVRLVLVPATMALLGKANWWLPAWLDRVVPELDPHGSDEIEADVTNTDDEDAVDDREPVLVG
jgi:RND superfamily putative drug exporter